MKLYIAGSSKDIDRCEHWVKAAREAGIEITCDWVAAMRAEGTGSDLTLDEEALRAYALRDLKGIDDADVVWLLAPPSDRISSGCWAELGYALAKGKMVVYSPPSKWREAVVPSTPVRPQFCIFATLVDEIWPTDEAALERLCAVAAWKSSRRIEE